MASTDPAVSRVRARLWWRFAIGAAAVAGLLLLLAPLLIARIAAGVLSDRLGAEVRIGSVEWHDWGRRWVVRDLRIGVRERDGDAGTIAAVDRLELWTERIPLLRGRLALQAAEIDGALLRLAEDAEDPTRLLLLELAPPPGDGDASAWLDQPLRVAVRRLRIEAGEARGDRFELRDARWFDGTLVSSGAGDADSVIVEFDLRETAPDGIAPAETPLLVSGTLEASPAGGVLRIEQLSLQPGLMRITPWAIRRWAEAMAPSGSVAPIAMAWQRPVDPDADPLWSVEMQVADLSMRLPDIDPALWARFRDGRSEPIAAAPKMRFERGTIAIGTERLRLRGIEGDFGEADGNARGVPFELEFDMDLAAVPAVLAGGTPAERLATNLLVAPFELRLGVREFRSRAELDGGTAAIDLPAPVARILDDLNAISWALDLEVRVHRESPLITAGGELIAAPLRNRGTLLLKEGEGAYFRFPYKLQGVTASIRFRDDLVEIDFVRGRGSADSRIEIAGTIRYRDDDAAIDLRIASADAAADAALIAALDAGPQELLATLFDETGAARLRDAGLLTAPAEIAEIELELGRLATRIRAAEHQGDADLAVALRAESQRLSRVVAAGPFELGGRIRMAIDLRQEFGVGAPLRTTGTIDLRRAGVVLRGFPYPLKVVGGRIRLYDESIELVGEGLEFTTIAGGTGWISGRIDVPRIPPATPSTSGDDDERGFEPHLQVVVRDDRVTPTLLAALPEPPAWLGASIGAPAPSERAVGWNRFVDARGAAGLEGRVMPSGDRDPRWRFLVDLSDLVITPKPPLLAALATRGIDCPIDAAVGGARGRVIATSEGVRIESIAGTFDGAAAEVHGWIDDDGRGTELTATLHALDGPRWIRAVAPQWRLTPRWLEGELDLTLDWRDEGEPQPPRLRVHGGWLDLGTADEARPTSPPLRFALDDGEIGIADGRIRFADALLALREAELDAGRLALDGWIAIGDEEEISVGDTADDGWAIRGGWEGLRPESASTRVALEWIHPEGLATLAELAPSGVVDLRFATRSHRERLDPAEPADHRLEFDLRPLRLEFDGGRCAIESSAGAPVRISFGGAPLRAGPFSVALAAIDGEGGIGPSGRLDAALSLAPTPTPRLDLRATLDLPALPFPGLDRLPGGVGAALARLDLAATEGMRLDDLDLRLEWPTADEPPGRIDLRGRLDLRGGAFSAGVPFRAVDATADLRFEASPGEALRGAVAVQVDRAIVFDRAVRGGTATLRYRDDEERIVVDPIEASLYGGLLSGRVSADLGQERFELDLLFDEVAAAPFLAGETDPGSAAGVGAGALRGRLGLGGSLVDDGNRVGRGRFLVEKGRLGRLPIGLRLLQLAELSLPLHESLADAEIQFHIAGERLVFERLEMTCDTLRLSGEGSVDLATMEIDTRLTSRGTTPIISDVMAPITGTLFAIELQGPVGDPRTTLRPLPGLAPRSRATASRAPEFDRAVPVPPASEDSGMMPR